MRHLNRRDIALVLEALARVVAARIAVRLRPFRRVAASLGAVGATAPEMLTSEQRSVVEDVKWAVDAAARRVPGDARCLARSVAAKGMLGRRGVPSTLYLGVRTRPFTAHAWVKAGDVIVTGAAQAAEFEVLTTVA